MIRRSIGAGVGLWLLELSGGMLGFLWPNLSRGFGGAITLGDLATVTGNPAVQGVSLPEGAPAYFSLARTYVQLIDPAVGFTDGTSTDGSGETTNVRTLYQRCPHLGCKIDYKASSGSYFCPCHASTFDLKGEKQNKIPPRGMDSLETRVTDGTVWVKYENFQGGIPEKTPVT